MLLSAAVPAVALSPVCTKRCDRMVCFLGIVLFARARAHARVRMRVRVRVHVRAHPRMRVRVHVRAASHPRMRVRVRVLVPMRVRVRVRVRNAQLALEELRAPSATARDGSTVSFGELKALVGLPKYHEDAKALAKRHAPSTVRRAACARQRHSSTQLAVVSCRHSSTQLAVVSCRYSSTQLAVVSCRYSSTLPCRIHRRPSRPPLHRSARRTRAGRSPTRARPQRLPPACPRRRPTLRCESASGLTRGRRRAAASLGQP